MHNMTFKPMTVDGFTVTEEVQRKAVEWMVARIRKDGPFKTAELEYQAASWRVPRGSNCIRFADRMAQKAKKAGVITYDRSFGAWILGPNAPEPSDA